MYIKNINLFPKTVDLFKTNKIIADWIQDNHGIPVLSISGRDYIFACNDSLRFALSKLPFYLKPLFKKPDCFK
jgi:hypothetical protein